MAGGTRYCFRWEVLVRLEELAGKGTISSLKEKEYKGAHDKSKKKPVGAWWTSDVGKGKGVNA